MQQRLVPLGRAFYGIGLIGIGIQHFLFFDFIAVIVPGWPAWIPGRSPGVYAAGAALIAAGALILAGTRARTVAALTGATILLLVALAHIPTQLASSPGQLGAWTNAFKALTLAGGAWVVADSIKERADFTRRLDPLLPLGRLALPITAVVFGIEHFVYPGFVATLVPKWIPGSVFWTYFAGIALIVSGLAMLLRVQARLASLLLGIMIFLWFILLHIPRAIADPRSGNGNEWTSAFEALAFSGIAFLTAAMPAPKPEKIKTNAASTVPR